MTQLRTTTVALFEKETIEMSQECPIVMGTLKRFEENP